MVEDHFAILKVGPWLTFALREAVLALTAIERELLATTSKPEISHVREALEAAMLRDTSYWRSYYRGDEDEVRRDRIYSYSDRCRYYLHQTHGPEGDCPTIRKPWTKTDPSHSR